MRKTSEFILTLLLSIFTVIHIHAQKLVFSDEFDGRAGQSIDAAKWTAETGGGGWGNQELQYYTNSAQSAYLDGKGLLVIKAVKLEPPHDLTCWYGPCQYTSARLVTKGKFEQKYGRFEARIKVPQGKGVWPAFWLLGGNIDSVGWPRCGEIDIMEHIGREPSTVYGTVHGPEYSGAKGIGGSYIFPNNRRVADDFHVYAVEWTSAEIAWFVDGKRYKTVTSKDLSKNAKWAFDHPFFIILNFAVGGQWPGSPDAETKFPQMMLVDYVRVYDR